MCLDPQDQQLNELLVVLNSVRVPQDSIGFQLNDHLFSATLPRLCNSLTSSSEHLVP